MVEGILHVAFVWQLTHFRAAASVYFRADALFWQLVYFRANASESLSLSSLTLFLPPSVSLARSRDC